MKAELTEFRETQHRYRAQLMLWDSAPRALIEGSMLNALLPSAAQSLAPGYSQILEDPGCVFAAGNGAGSSPWGVLVSPRVTGEVLALVSVSH